MDASLQVRHALDEVLGDRKRAKRRLQGHVVDDVVVRDDPQQPLAHPLRLPPSAECAVGHARGAERDDGVRLPAPVVQLGHGGGEDGERSAQAVAGENDRPILGHGAEQAEPRADEPLLHLRQHAVQRLYEALVHHAGAEVAAQLQTLPCQVGVDLPVLHGGHLRPPEDNDGEFVVLGLQDPRLDVVAVVVEHLLLPIADLGAQVRLPAVGRIADLRS
mmetsp:Transcript_34147/g.99120  ORF Transcript_34147/g.99120 Transcript_34147/m.99120 type:complete len:218 (+) Transcript_34147:298-951(+)